MNEFISGIIGKESELDVQIYRMVDYLSCEEMNPNHEALLEEIADKTNIISVENKKLKSRIKEIEVGLDKLLSEMCCECKDSIDTEFIEG